MKDKLVEVLSASARREVIAPPEGPFLDLVSFRSLTAEDIPAIRAFQSSVLADLDLQLFVVGGGYGCTRVTISVVADTPEETAKLLRELFSSNTFRDEALKANFDQLVRYEPITKKDLKTGVIEGVLEDQGLLLFCSYSHQDETHRVELDKHLSPLKRQGLIREWHDRRISAGTEWARQIDENLENADIIVLLISSDFLSSDYCYDIEMRRALDRHKERRARVIPVIVRPVDWEGTLFAHLQAVPKDGRAVTSWSNTDEAWKDVAKQIRMAVREIRKSL